MNNNNWIKIDNETFYVKEVMIQLTVMAHATIDLSFDIKSYPSYSDIFFNMYEKGSKFNIVAKEFEGKGIMIKAVDVGSKIMNISLKCDLLNHKDISERRDEIIEEVLNNNNKNNIN
jgi:hypothetical protein